MDMSTIDSSNRDDDACGVGTNAEKGGGVAISGMMTHKDMKELEENC